MKVSHKSASYLRVKMKDVHLTTVQVRISIFFTFNVLLYFKLTLGTKAMIVVEHYLINMKIEQ
jgi:hypothetical protein